jgi:hypothetical protein
LELCPVLLIHSCWLIEALVHLEQLFQVAERLCR